MTSYLVTGGAGFIGSHLCDRLLAEGHVVMAIDDLSSGRLANLVEARGYGPRFTFYSVDILAAGLPGLLERHRPEVAFHLARRLPAADGGDPGEQARVGVLGLLAVLDAAAVGGVSKLVFASSACLYGRTRSVPARETALPAARALSLDAVAKRAAEDYLRFYKRTRGLDFTSVVLPAVYGPRQDPAGGVVSAFAECMVRNERPTMDGDGEQTRDFLFVDDAVHALCLAASRGSGRTINVGSGLETSVAGVYRLLAAITGFGGAPILGPPRPDDIARSALDASLAARELGWKPWTHLEDGLRETVAFVRGS